LYDNKENSPKLKRVAKPTIAVDAGSSTMSRNFDMGFCMCAMYFIAGVSLSSIEAERMFASKYIADEKALIMGLERRNRRIS
jgi:hypothetical protein